MKYTKYSMKAEKENEYPVLPEDDGYDNFVIRIVLYKNNTTFLR